MKWLPSINKAFIIIIIIIIITIVYHFQLSVILYCLSSIIVYHSQLSVIPHWHIPLSVITHHLSISHGIHHFCHSQLSIISSCLLSYSHDHQAIWSLGCHFPFSTISNCLPLHIVCYMPDIAYCLLYAPDIAYHNDKKESLNLNKCLALVLHKYLILINAHGSLWFCCLNYMANMNSFLLFYLIEVSQIVVLCFASTSQRPIVILNHPQLKTLCAQLPLFTIGRMLPQSVVTSQSECQNGDHCLSHLSHCSGISQSGHLFVYHSNHGTIVLPYWWHIYMTEVIRDNPLGFRKTQIVNVLFRATQTYQEQSKCINWQ